MSEIQKFRDKVKTLEGYADEYVTLTKKTLVVWCAISAAAGVVVLGLFRYFVL